MRLKKFSIVFVILLFTLSVYNPIVSSTFSNGLLSSEFKGHDILKNDKPCVLKMCTYNLDTIVENNINISFEEAFSLIKNMKNTDTFAIQDNLFTDYEANNIESLEKIYSRQFPESPVFKKLHNIQKTDISNNQQSNVMVNMFCRVNAKLLGLGLLLGTHSIPLVSLAPGFDIGGLFMGLGTVDVTGGILENEHHSGLCFGGLFGFLGTVFFIIIPLIPGPFIYIDGFSLASIWL